MVQTTNQLVEKKQEVGIRITPEIKTCLKETSKWTNFLAYFGFFILGFVAIAAIYMGFNMYWRANEYTSVASSPVFITCMYLLFVAVLFFPVNYLYRFASTMKAALKSEDQDQLNTSFKALTAFHRYIGFVLISGLIIYVALLVGMLFFGMTLM